MRKAEYIERYGQDAWDRKTEKTKIWHQQHPDYNKKWRAEHPQQNLKKEEYIEIYGETAWERKLESGRRWKDEHKDQHIENVKQWQRDNKDKSTEYKTKWKKNNPKDTRAQNLSDAYKSTDKVSGRGDSTITKQWILDNIFNSSCIYCGDSNWKHLGCDRIDNNLPHTPDNVVCSCGICNVERGDRMSVEEFIEYRKTHPRDEEPKKLQEIVEVNGIKVIKKVL